MKSRVWVLVAVTYGAVILVAILAVVGYYRMSPAAKQEENPQTGNIEVGTMWIPLYPGSLLTDRTSSTSGGVIESTVKLKSPESTALMLAFYQARLGAGRYRLRGTSKTDTGGSVHALERDGKGTVFITVTALDRGSEVKITTVEKPRPPVILKRADPAESQPRQ